MATVQGPSRPRSGPAQAGGVAGAGAGQRHLRPGVRVLGGVRGERGAGGGAAVLVPGAAGRQPLGLETSWHSRTRAGGFFQWKPEGRNTWNTGCFRESCGREGKGGGGWVWGVATVVGFDNLTAKKEGHRTGCP